MGAKSIDDIFGLSLYCLQEYGELLIQKGRDFILYLYNDTTDFEPTGYFIAWI